MTPLAAGAGGNAAEGAAWGKSVAAQSVEGDSPPHRGEVGQPGYQHHLAAAQQQRPAGQGAPRILAQTQVRTG